MTRLVHLMKVENRSLTTACVALDRTLLHPQETDEMAE